MPPTVEAVPVSPTPPTNEDLSALAHELTYECFKKGLPPPMHLMGKRDATLVQGLEAWSKAPILPQPAAGEDDYFLVATDPTVSALAMECFRRGIDAPLGGVTANQPEGATSPVQARAAVVKELLNVLRKSETLQDPTTGYELPVEQQKPRYTDEMLNNLSHLLEEKLLEAQAVPAETYVAPTSLLLPSTAAEGEEDGGIKLIPDRSHFSPGADTDMSSEVSFPLDGFTQKVDPWSLGPYVGPKARGLGKTGPLIPADQEELLPSTPMVKARGVPRQVRRVLVPPMVTLVVDSQYPPTPELFDLLVAENAHRAEGMRWEAKSFFRIVRAFLYVLEEKSFLAKEGTLAQTRAEKWLRQQRLQNPSKKSGDDKAAFLRAEKERELKRIQDRLNVLPKLETDARRVIETDENNEIRQIYHDVIGYWLEPLLKARQEVLDEESTERTEIRTDEQTRWDAIHHKVRLLRTEYDEERARITTLLPLEDTEYANLTKEYHRQTDVLKDYTNRKLALNEEETKKRKEHEAHEAKSFEEGPHKFWKKGWETIRKQIAENLASTQDEESVIRNRVKDSENGFWKQIRDPSDMIVDEWKKRCGYEHDDELERQHFTFFSDEDTARVEVEQDAQEDFNSIQSAENKARATRTLEWGIILLVSKETNARGALTREAMGNLMDLMHDCSRVYVEDGAAKVCYKDLLSVTEDAEYDLRRGVNNARAAFHAKMLLNKTELFTRRALYEQIACEREREWMEEVDELLERMLLELDFEELDSRFAVVHDEGVKFCSNLAPRGNRILMTKDAEMGALAVAAEYDAEWAEMMKEFDAGVAAIKEEARRRPAILKIQKVYRAHLARVRFLRLLAERGAKFQFHLRREVSAITIQCMARSTRARVRTVAYRDFRDQCKAEHEDMYQKEFFARKLIVEDENMNRQIDVSEFINRWRLIRSREASDKLEDLEMKARRVVSGSEQRPRWALASNGIQEEEVKFRNAVTKSESSSALRLTHYQQTVQLVQQQETQRLTFRKAQIEDAETLQRTLIHNLSAIAWNHMVNSTTTDLLNGLVAYEGALRQALEDSRWEELLELGSNEKAGERWAVEEEAEIGNEALTTVEDREWHNMMQNETRERLALIKEELANVQTEEAEIRKMALNDDEADVWDFLVTIERDERYNIAVQRIQRLGRCYLARKELEFRRKLRKQMLESEETQYAAIILQGLHRQVASKLKRLFAHRNRKMIKDSVHTVKAEQEERVTIENEQATGATELQHHKETIQFVQSAEKARGVVKHEEETLFGLIRDQFQSEDTEVRNEMMQLQMLHLAMRRLEDEEEALRDGLFKAQQHAFATHVHDLIRALCGVCEIEEGLPREIVAAEEKRARDATYEVFQTEYEPIAIRDANRDRNLNFQKGERVERDNIMDDEMDGRKLIMARTLASKRALMDLGLWFDRVWYSKDLTQAKPFFFTSAAAPRPASPPPSSLLAQQQQDGAPIQPPAWPVRQPPPPLTNDNPALNRTWPMRGVGTPPTQLEPLGAKNPNPIRTAWGSPTRGGVGPFSPLYGHGYGPNTGASPTSYPAPPYPSDVEAFSNMAPLRQGHPASLSPIPGRPPSGSNNPSAHLGLDYQPFMGPLPGAVRPPSGGDPALRGKPFNPYVPSQTQLASNQSAPSWARFGGGAGAYQQRGLYDGRLPRDVPR